MTRWGGAYVDKGYGYALGSGYRVFTYISLFFEYRKFIYTKWTAEGSTEDSGTYDNDGRPEFKEYLIGFSIPIEISF